MDTIALISDIHGNVPALQATLRDIARRRIHRIFCLGDLVGKGPHGEKVVDMCRTVCEPGGVEEGVRSRVKRNGHRH
jgi:protein phosphatase